ncbi:MAG: chitinase [Acidimicrobiales bacterium]
MTIRRTRPTHPSTRRISPLRMLTVAASTIGVLGGGAVWASELVQTTFDRTEPVAAGAYVDVSLTPVLHFEDPAVYPLSHATLAFVVADGTNPCDPSWGGYYSLEGAGRALDLDRRIARLRERGGDVSVSFGGALNAELARTCTDETDLADAYRSVIERYDVQRLDFDIEGEGLADEAAHQRRARTLAALQQAQPELQIWLTVPVSPAGLPTEAQRLVELTLAGGVELAGVNLMTMNFGASRAADQDMFAASAAALEATATQLAQRYRAAGQTLTDSQIWQRMGATPMIGQNDVTTDVFTVQDAGRLAELAGRRGLGWLSMWSANRDARCGAAVEGNQVSNTCSGVSQDAAGFALMLAGATTQPHVNADATEGSMNAPAGVKDAPRDDPATSPYPIWRSSKTYAAGDKVVWHAKVYEAKWWASGELPDAAVAHSWDTPWRYLGPVLEGDGMTAPDAVAAVAGVQQRWTADGVYLSGTQVVHGTAVFKAKWWTQGTTPEQDPDRPFDHPWEFLGKTPPETAGAGPVS